MIAAVLLAAGLHVDMPAQRPWVDVGTRRLFRCSSRNSGVAVAGFCDVLRVPIDWNDPAAGTIGVRFEWIPAKAPGSTATIVAEEGGPGFPSTKSGLAYYYLFWPLHADHNILLMDERGTGASAPIDCDALQKVVTTDVVGDFQSAVAVCGAQLNSTFLRTDGRGFVHASDLFATPQSVRDLVAIVRALRLPPVDLYGDSYGTFFAQAFAANHPELLRSVVLDSAYPLDQDLFDLPAREEIRFAYDTVCSRSLACAAAAPGSSTDRIRRLAQRLAAAPLVTAKHRYDAHDLETLLQAASLDDPLLEYRNLDAAARAWLERDDALPLARLFGWSQTAAALPSSYTAYSVGMEVAAECTLYRTPFDMHAPYEERLRQYRAAVDALPPASFDPIPKAESMADAGERFDQCLRWPAPVHDDPVVRLSPPLLPASLPVLMISGELDSITPPGDAQVARERLGPSVRFVSIANSGHVPTYYDLNDCAERIARAFISSPEAPLDTACVQRVPEVRAVGVFPATLADQPPASPRAGDAATPSEARLAALAVGAVGDTLQTVRFAFSNDSTCGFGVCGQGLRGGAFTASWNMHRIRLVRIAYSRDSTVSGTVSVAQGLIPTAPGVVSGTLHVRLERTPLEEDLTVRWDERQPRALATIDGRASSGHAIHEVVPAP